MSTIQVIVDDADVPPSDYEGTQWVHETKQVDNYGGTLSVCDAGSTTTTLLSSPPSLTFEWDGADLVIYGIMTEGVAGTYNIDFGPSQPMIFSNSTVGKPGVELWKLTGLLSDHHILSINSTAGNLTIDYVTYTPSGLTRMTGQNLIFDDQDPALQYSMGWVNTTNEQYPQGAPYLGTTMGTNTVGSSMALNFTGQFVAVYGALQQVPGILNASFSVDNGEPAVNTIWDGTQSNTSEWLVTSQIFRTLILAPGPHTLYVSLQEATGSQMLWLDSVITQAGDTTTLSNAAGSGPSAVTPSGGIAPVPTYDPSPTANSGLSDTLKRSLIGGGGGLVTLIIVIFILRITR